MKITRKKAVEMAIAALEQARHKYAVRCAGSQINFEFGQKAKVHYDEYTEAIEQIKHIDEQKAMF